jgi:phage/plasmid-like protein (TIGR03299 family)
MTNRLTPLEARRPAFETHQSFQQFDLADRVSPTEAMKRTGLDTPVSKTPIYNNLGEKIEGKAETRRDGNHLGIVGEKTYHVIPWKDSLLPYTEALTLETPFSVQAAGKLRGGAQELMIMGWPEELLVNGERFNGSMWLGNSHDGSSAIWWSLEYTRFFCTNQVPKVARMAQLRFRHTLNWAMALEEARRALGISLAYNEVFAAEMDRQMKTPFAEKKFIQFVQKIAPTEDEKGLTKKGRGWTMAKNTQDGLMESLRTEDLNDHKGTLFAAEQAVAAYYDWGYSSDRTRAERNLSGATDRVKTNALKVLRTFAYRGIVHPFEYLK